MSPRNILSIGTLVIAVLFAVTLPTLSVAEDDLDGQSRNGIIEGPDPMNPATGSWKSGEPVEDNDSIRDLIEDGSPAVGLLPGTNWPLVVWSHDAGPDRDIAFVEWTGESWTNGPTFLTSSTADELDPAIHVDVAGTVHVVWWEDADPQSVMMTLRPSGAEAWEPAIVVSQSARRPSVVVSNGDVLVAFERDSIASGQEVVVATFGADGLVFDVVAETHRSGSLDVALHAEDGRVWVEWNEETVYELRGGEWTPPTSTLSVAAPREDEPSEPRRFTRSDARPR